MLAATATSDHSWPAGGLRLTRNTDVGNSAVRPPVENPSPRAVPRLPNRTPPSSTHLVLVNLKQAPLPPISQPHAHPSQPPSSAHPPTPPTWSNTTFKQKHTHTIIQVATHPPGLGGTRAGTASRAAAAPRRRRRSPPAAPVPRGRRRPAGRLPPSTPRAPPGHPAPCRPAGARSRRPVAKGGWRGVRWMHACAN